VDALRLFPAAVLAVVLPSLVRDTGTGSLFQVSAGLTGFAVGVTLALWPLAGWLVTLVYGGAYAEAVPAFRILLLSFPLMSLNYALTHQLIGWQRHRAYAAICGMALVFNLASNARLIPALSIVGAAWATVGTELVVTFGCAAVLWRARSRQRTHPVGVGAAS
jgi:O-antigen/teichoic acid export membrane protein